MREVLFAILFLLPIYSLTEAATVDSETGYSAFNATVDALALTITITETPISSRASFQIHFSDDEIEGTDVWTMTRTITNGTGDTWTYYDLELKVPCDIAGNTYQCQSGPVGGQTGVSSPDDDLVSWRQGNPGRIETSTAFPTLTSIEGGMDYIRFSGGSVAPGGTDTQVNEFIYALQFGDCDDNVPYDCPSAVEVVEYPSTVNPTCYDVASTTYTFEDISTTGVVLVDSFSGQARLGFTMDYFDRHIDSIMVDSLPIKGYLDMENGDRNTTGANVNLNTTQAPTASNDVAMTVAMWNNFVFVGSASGDVRQQQFGTAPNRYFIVQWTNACAISSCDDPVTNEASLATFQMKFFEIDDSIEVHLKDADTSNSSTIGIRDQNGETDCTTDPTPSPCEFQCTTDGIPTGCDRVEQWSFNTAQSDETAIRFTRSTCPVTEGDWGWTHRP